MAEEENEEFSNQDKGLKSDDEDSMESSESDDSDQNAIEDSNVAELQKTVKIRPLKITCACMHRIWHFSTRSCVCKSNSLLFYPIVLL